MSEQTVLPHGPIDAAQDVKSPEIPFKYQDELSTFKQLMTEFGAEIEATKVRRQLRANRQNVAELRQQGILLPDETIIPDRTIEQNCQNEIIPYIAFTEQPNQVLSFHDPAAPGMDYTLYADWITSVIRYENWQLPWQFMEDSMVLHGAGHHEVVFDADSPSKFSIEYVRREHLIFPRDTKDIQACLRIARKYEVTKHQLDLLASAFSFDATVVSKIKEHYKTKSTFISIYKYFLRDENNYVYNAWMAEEELSANTWLRAPMPHFLGDYGEPTVDPLSGVSTPQQLPTTIYPFFSFPYRTQEDEAILLVQGQAALSSHVQDALTGVFSGVVNTCTRAAGVYAARDNQPGNTPEVKPLYPLKPGYVHDGSMKFFSLPWPNPVALSIAQALGVKNASQQGQTDFAAMSRQDTAKRATEIVAAKEEADKIKTARISLFSTRCLAEYRVIFNIIRNQIKIGGITLPANLDPAPLFSPTLVITMAADTQVVKREQRKQKLAEFWPVVAPTPLAPVYFEAMVAELFPEDWPIWKNAMEQLKAQQTASDPTQALAQFVTDLYPTLPPEQGQIALELLKQIPTNDQSATPPNVAG